MEQTKCQNRPENLDDKLFNSLYGGLLTTGVDLDDLIFHGEEYHQSER